MQLNLPYPRLFVYSTIIVLFFWSVPTLLVANLTNRLFPTAASPITQQIDLPEFDQPLQTQGHMIGLVENNQVTQIEQTIAASSTATPIDLTNQPLQISYRDDMQRIHNLPWHWRFQGDHDQDNWLETGERIQIAIDTTSTLAAPLQTNRTFVIEIALPTGAVLSLVGTTPHQFAPTITLN